MLHRVAEALDKSCRDQDAKAFMNSVIDCDTLARVAVEAMREATYEMLLEGQSVVNLSEEPGRYKYISREECQEIWQTMIDAAKGKAS